MKFFGGLLWLGFWYKLLIIIIFDNYQFKEGSGLFMSYDFNTKIQILDKALITICYGLAGFLLACFVKNIPLNNFYKLKKIQFKNNKYLNKKILILFILIFVVSYLTVTFSNFYLGIYQRGILPTYNVHFTISAVYKWLLLFGFSSFVAFLYFFAFNSKSKIYTLSTISIVETFVTNLSFLSRGMIFNLFAIFIGLYKSNKFYKLKINIRFFLIYLFSILIFFYLCVISVNYLRANVFFVKIDNTKIENLKYSDNDKQAQTITPEIEKKYDTKKDAFKEFLSLSKTRWVGIDALIAVESFEKKNFKFLKQSFKDKFDKDKFPFYERNVQKRVKKNNNTIQYGITTPGIFAFIYYSGSQFFLFISIFFISLLVFTFERFVYFIFNNLLLCSILSQVIAYRLIHFGYMPQNTYMLLTSILITIFGLFLINKLVLKSNDI